MVRHLYILNLYSILIKEKEMNTKSKKPISPPRFQYKFWLRYGLLIKSLIISLLILAILQTTLWA
jgi:hypothetical protein